MDILLIVVMYDKDKRWIYMLMEIYLSEEKAKKNNIDLNECYQKIDKYFKSRGVEIVSKGIYKGVRKDFDTFAIAQGSLPDTKCF